MHSWVGSWGGDAAALDPYSCEFRRHTKGQRDDPVSPVSAPGTETKPSLRLSISFCSSAIQHHVNKEPQTQLTSKKETDR